MVAKIFYFSGTGNSLYLAKQMKREISNIESIEIISIQRAMNTYIDWNDIDVIGIFSPVYKAGLPNIVEQFCNRIPNNKYIFAVINYAIVPGSSVGVLQKLFKERNSKLDLAFTIRMPNNYIMLSGSPNENSQKRLLDRGSKKIKKISIYINNRKSKIRRFHNPFNFIFSLFNRVYKKESASLDRHFWVDEKCNGCGVCEDICLIKNIMIRNDRPMWNHNCEQCLSCLQWCPKKSIQYGKVTKNRERYKNPYIKLSELIDG